MKLPPIGLALALLAGCAAPAADYARNAQGLVARRIEGTGFHHQVFAKPGQGGRLHLYLEGDGTPWFAGRAAMADPTPRQAVALALLRLDPRALRPCALVTPQVAAGRGTRLPARAAAARAAQDLLVAEVAQSRSGQRAGAGGDPIRIEFIGRRALRLGGERGEQAGAENRQADANNLAHPWFHTLASRWRH
ncbi:MAG: hypothetical protein FJX68_05460 [Alphaproteobacteria bacterium]|nr:hypothetical protein [Alphaproteobacteria bacterium]